MATYFRIFKYASVIILQSERIKNLKLKIQYKQILTKYMEITKVSSEGQVILPEELLKASGWKIGQELIAINMGDGILLKPKKPFTETTLKDVAGCLKYEGSPKSLEEMNDAIRQGVEESWHGGS